MNLSESIKNYILTSLDMDLVGIAPAAALAGEPSGHRPEELLLGAPTRHTATIWPPTFYL